MASIGLFELVGGVAVWKVFDWFINRRNPAEEPVPEEGETPKPRDLALHYTMEEIKRGGGPDPNAIERLRFVSESRGVPYSIDSNDLVKTQAELTMNLGGGIEAPREMTVVPMAGDKRSEITKKVDMSKMRLMPKGRAEETD